MFLPQSLVFFQFRLTDFLLLPRDELRVFPGQTICLLPLLASFFECPSLAQVFLFPRPSILGRFGPMRFLLRRQGALLFQAEGRFFLAPDRLRDPSQGALRFELRNRSFQARLQAGGCFRDETVQFLDTRDPARGILRPLPRPFQVGTLHRRDQRIRVGRVFDKLGLLIENSVDTSELATGRFGQHGFEKLGFWHVTNGGGAKREDGPFTRSEP